MTWTRLYLPLMVAAVAACASGSSGTGRASCTMATRDSIYLRRGVVYRDCAVETRAVATDKSAHPDFRPSSSPPGGSACYSAEIEFVVDTAGVPEVETATVLRTNEPAYATAAVEALARWRYRPATIHGFAVRQIVQEKQSMAIAVVRVPAGQTPHPPVRARVC
jgi:hypothetical protein